MSGVRTGTRLQQLQQLRQRVAHQITHAHQRGHPLGDLPALAHALDIAINAETRPRPLTIQTDQARAELGVPAAVVRAWAVAQGLMEGGRRGRVPRAVIDMYAAHQRTTEHHEKAGTPR